MKENFNVLIPKDKSLIKRIFAKLEKLGYKKESVAKRVEEGWLGDERDHYLLHVAQYSGIRWFDIGDACYHDWLGKCETVTFTDFWNMIFEPDHITIADITQEYSASIDKKTGEIKVGCQTVSPKKAKELLDALNSIGALK